jgi:hypothetical protein
MPFTERGSYENYSTIHDVYVQTIDGVIQKIPLDSNAQKEYLHGPHRYKVVFFVAFTWGPLLPEYLIDPLYEHLFCSGIYAVGTVSAVRIIHTEKRTGKVYSTYEYLCK